MNAPLRLTEKPVASYVPYSHHVTQTVVATTAMEYLSIIKVGGRSADGYSLATQNEWIEALNNILRGLEIGSVGFWSHVIRRRINEYPDSEFDQPFAQKFDSDYRATFDQGSLMINDLYLTVIVRPNTDAAMGAFAALEKANSKEQQAWQDEAIAKIEDITRNLLAGLGRYDAEVLSIVERDGFLFSEPAEFLGYLLNGDMHPVPVTRTSLAEAIVFSRPVFSRWGEMGELRLASTTRRFGMVEVRDYPDESRAGHLDCLLKLPFEFILSQSWGSFTRAHAKNALKKHRRLLIDSGDDSQSQIKQLLVALDDLATGKWGLGDHHATVMVLGESTDDVRAGVARLGKALADVSIVAKPLDLALEAAFWAQLPCNWSWRPRPTPITSYNFLSYSSFHNQLTGKPTGNPWGPAVTMLKTETQSPFFLNFHATLDDVDETGKRRLGNTMIIGKSGTGKTVLLSAALTQAQKFRPTTVVWDKDRGMQVTIMALGGSYFPLKFGRPTGWAPYQMEPTRANLAFMRRFTAFLASRRGESISTRQYAEIEQAVTQMTELMDVRDRRISTLITLLPNPLTDEGTSSIHARLMPWCQGGEFGWLFDGNQDTLNLDGNTLFGFDMTEFLENDDIRGATNMYLQHRVDALCDGRRFIQITDECQHPLKDEFYQQRMQDQSRTIRKKNGLLVFATQEPNAILENPVGKSLLQQAATVIYLPNPEATRQDYIDGFKLTESEFALVKGLGEFSRKMVVKQGGNTTVAQLDLKHCNDALLVFSGSEDMAELAEQAVAEFGEDPEQWLPAYLERARRAQS